MHHNHVFKVYVLLAQEDALDRFMRDFFKYNII